ncbi:hypothetical protein PoB_000598200 [Plakobranchus ocellatus]|uniref:HTH iclR-type domain-containing protein n=1 Tax=Plakobranchus ocellatus TaxID=259542 RepID=A0AAV3YBJ9_9GAST|nr:hypothetical protein PoB_000598200 [Plakobranchus ocellatus]
MTCSECRTVQERTIIAVDEIIKQDRLFKAREIAEKLEISKSTGHRIIFEQVNYRKVFRQMGCEKADLKAHDSTDQYRSKPYGSVQICYWWTNGLW